MLELLVLVILTHQNAELHEDLGFEQDALEDACDDLYLQVRVDSLVEELLKLFLLSLGREGPRKVLTNFFLHLIIN